MTAFLDLGGSTYQVSAKIATDSAERLEEAGDRTLIYYAIPPHRQRAYSGMSLAEDSLPITERLAETMLSLSFVPPLGLDQAELVTDAAL